jgi:hypothetical protein
MKMRSQVKLPPLLLLMMMIIYLHRNGYEKLVVMFWDTMDYDAYAIIDDIVMTQAHADEDILKEKRNKSGKLDPEEGEDKEEEAEREETDGKSEVPIPIVSEALEAIRVVNGF